MNTEETYGYVAMPNIVQEVDDGPDLAVGYPIDSNPVLVWQHEDRAEPIIELSDDGIDSMRNEMLKTIEHCPFYRDNDN